MRHSDLALAADVFQRHVRRDAVLNAQYISINVSSSAAAAASVSVDGAAASTTRFVALVDMPSAVGRLSEVPSPVAQICT